MAEPAGSSSSSPDTDRDFDPSADMMIHDYDDERTLDEEEALSGDSCANELEDLEKEGDMPIEDLLAMYGAPGGGGGPPPDNSNSQSSSSSSSEEEILENQDLTLDKETIARDLHLPNETDETETSVSDLYQSVSSSSNTARLLRSSSQPGSEEELSDSEEDDDYKPEHDEDWKKVIHVGSCYQAVVPEGLCKYGDAPAYENDDRMLWDPSKIEDETVVQYLVEVQKQALQNATGVHAIPSGDHVRDDEQALYSLQQCGHSVEEALRRRKMINVMPTDPMSLWSEEECRNFENGLRTYGKNFYLIQQNKVRTRSVGELVQFYYLWKKTERHDAFANKTRLDKRKYNVHPGVTDYMDRFIDDAMNSGPARDRSTSPSLSSLAGGEQKRPAGKPDLEEAKEASPSTAVKAASSPEGSSAASALPSAVSSSLPPAPPSVPSTSRAGQASSPGKVNGATDGAEPPAKRARLSTDVCGDNGHKLPAPEEEAKGGASLCGTDPSLASGVASPCLGRKSVPEVDKVQAEVVRTGQSPVKSGVQ